MVETSKEAEAISEGTSVILRRRVSRLPSRRKRRRSRPSREAALITGGESGILSRGGEVVLTAVSRTPTRQQVRPLPTPEVLKPTRELIIAPSVREEIRIATTAPGISRTPAQRTEAIRRLEERGLAMSPLGRFEAELGTRARIAEAIIGVVREPRKTAKEAGARFATFVSEERDTTALRSPSEVIRPISFVTTPRLALPTREELAVERFKRIPGEVAALAGGVALSVIRDPSSFLIESFGLTKGARFLTRARLGTEARGFERTLTRLEEPSIDPRLRFDPRIGGVVTPVLAPVEVFAPVITPGQRRLPRSPDLVPITGVIRGGEVRFFEDVRVARKPTPTIPRAIKEEFQTVLPSGLSPIIAVTDPGKGFGLVATAKEIVAAKVPARVLRGRRGVGTLFPVTTGIVRGGEELISIFRSRLERAKRARVVRPGPFVTPRGLISPGGSVFITPAPAVAVAVPEVTIRTVGLIARAKPIRGITAAVSLIPITTPIEKIIAGTKPRSRVGEKTKPALAIAPALAIRSIFEAPPITVRRPRTVTRPATIVRPFVPRLKIPTKVTRERARLTPARVISFPGAFDVFLRRRGEFRRVGRGLTRPSAIGLGARRVKAGLGATFRLIPVAGRPSKAKIGIPAGFGDEFRRFKKVKGAKIPLVDEFIQRRKFRLATVGERREIRRARRGGFF